MKEGSINRHWNADATYALGLYRLIAYCLGIWNRDIISLLQILCITLLQIFMFISIAGELNFNCGASNDVVQMVSLASCTIVALLKVLLIRFNYDKMMEVILSIIEDWRSVDNLSARKIMKNNARLGRNICIFQMASTYCTVIPIVIGALPFLVPENNSTINTTDIVIKSLPLRTACFFGDISTSVYAAVYIIQTIQLLITATGNVGCDCYFFGITLNLVAQIECLTLDFETFVTKQSSNFDCREIFKKLVERHRKLINHASHIEKTFNIVILFQVAVNCTQICLNGIQMIISIRIGDTVTIFNVIIILCIVNLQIFLYCYAGDRLSSATTNVQTAAYNCEWYHLSPKIVKNLTFVMMRSNKTFNLTAGKVYYMNLDSFKNIIKAMGSYFSVLQAMFDN